ncbi:Asp/Glu/hydantoin racemase [Trichoderma longibrachiatum]
MSLADPPRLSNSIRILLLNPNSSRSMTKSMEAAANSIATLYPSVSISTYTAPEPSPASIDNAEGIHASVQAVINDPDFKTRLQNEAFDAVLVACFSVHPLVKHLANALKPIPVTGIFEASILTALSLVPLVQEEQRKWGIVTTGAFWEAHLADGVAAFLGQTPSTASATGSSSFSDARFAGVFSTGLNAGDFHEIPQEQINVRLREATKRLLSSGDVTCVVMGCGGMGGLQDMICAIVVEEYGQQRARDVSIVDGVQAGVLQLQQAVLSRRVFGVK